MQFYLKCVYVRHLKMIECQYLALQEQRSGRCGIQYRQPLDKGCGQMCQKQVLCQKHEIFGTLVSLNDPLAERRIRIEIQLLNLFPSAVKSPFGNPDLIRNHFDRDIHKSHMMNASES